MVDTGGDTYLKFKAEPNIFVDPITPNTRPSDS